MAGAGLMHRDARESDGGAAAVIVEAADDRVLEDGELRVTEDGEIRETE